MRLVVNASPLSWPACGTRTYLTALLSSFDRIGVLGQIDLVRPAGYRGVTVQRATPTSVVPNGHGDLRRRWLWEQVTLPLHPVARGNVLFTPYVAPSRRDASSFALLDVLPWLDRLDPAPPLDRLARRATAASARRSELVLAISEFTRAEAVRVLRLDPSSVEVVTLAAADSFGPQDDDLVARVLRECGLARPYVLWSGGYGSRKHPEVLVDAVARCGSDAVVVLVGRPPAGLLTRAAALGVDVRSTGFIDDKTLARLYAGAETSCYFSDYEGYGLPPVEAVACGTPVVCSPLAPVRATLGERVAYVDHADPEQVAAALDSAMSGPRPEPWRARSGLDVAQETWDAHLRRWPDLGPAAEARS